MLRLLALTFLSAVAISPADAQFSGRLPEEVMPGLRTVIESALEDSNDVEMLVLSEREAEGQRLAQRAAILPRLGASVSFRQEEDQDQANTAGFEERVIYRVAVTQPLYHWGVKRAEKQMGDILYAAEMLNAEGSGLNIVRKVRADYMSLVIARQELAAAEQALKLRQGNLDFQREQLEAGAVSSSVVDRVAFEVDRLELLYLREKNSWESKLEDLAAYVGSSPEAIEAALAESIPAVEPLSEEAIRDLDRFFDEGLEQDPALRRRELELELERKRLHIERKSLYPKVDAEVGVSSNALDRDGVRREQEFVYFGVNVGWNIFDGFRTKGRKLEVVNRLARAAKARDQLKETTLRSYSRVLAGLDLARRAMTLEERALEQARAQLEETKQGIEEQRLASAELAGADSSYNQAFVSAQRARVAYLGALSEFTLLLGLDPVAFDDNR